MAPKISIIVPVYNVEKYLPACINSLIKQTLSDIEVLLINDGSTDSSGLICKDFASKDSRVKYFQKLNEGLSKTRNFGMQKASGEYIMFVDSDDWINKETCEISYSYALKTNADLVIFSYIREYENRSLEKKIDIDAGFYENENFQLKIRRRFVGLIGAELKHPQNADSISTVCGKLFRASLIKETRFFDTSLIGTEDALFNLQASAGFSSAYYIGKPLYHYRKTNKSSLTSNHKHNLLIKWKHLWFLMGEIVNSENKSLEFKEALNNRICLSLIGIGLNEISETNTKSINKKINSLKKILRDHQIKGALKNLDLKDFPLHWRVFFFFAKHQLVIGLYLMLFAIKKLKGKI